MLCIVYSPHFLSLGHFSADTSLSTFLTLAIINTRLSDALKLIPIGPLHRVSDHATESKRSRTHRVEM